MQVKDMIEACPTCLGYVFSQMQATVGYYTQDFIADVDGFVSWPRIKHWELFNNFSRWSLVPIRRNSVLLGLSSSLDPVIQAYTPIKQCCNFSIDSLAFETDIDM